MLKFFFYKLCLCSLNMLLILILVEPVEHIFLPLCVNYVLQITHFVVLPEALFTGYIDVVLQTQIYLTLPSIILFCNL